MKRALHFVFFALPMTALGQLSAEFMDRLQEKLTVSAINEQVRARLSGTVDLEVYAFDEPAPALLFSERRRLVNPRLSTFLDVQAGTKLYGFAQARIDRGFDPSQGDLEFRLDEYALRLTPWEDGRVNLQVGRFATVVGNWVRRHSTWDNPFVTAPAPYEVLTAMWDGEAVENTGVLLQWAHLPGAGALAEYGDKHLRLPIIWGPSYATGVALSGAIGEVEYAVEIKNGSLSSRPEYWGPEKVDWDDPTFSARVGYKPSPTWDLGISASSGTYLLPMAEATVPQGYRLDDYRQTVWAADISYAYRYLQVWAEFFSSRFEIPLVGDADVIGYYIEAKYKLTPQWFLSLRWNEQRYGTIPDEQGHPVRWGRNLWRMDLAPTYRINPYLQVKIQLSIQHETAREDPWSHFLALQFTQKF